MSFRTGRAGFIPVMSLLVVAAALSAAQAPLSVIPRPSQMTPGTGTFLIDAQTQITADTDAVPCAQYFAETLQTATGFTLSVNPAKEGANPSSGVAFRIDPTLARLGDEGYTLLVAAEGAEIRAFKPAGLLYACQTLLQLLPVEIFSRTRVEGVSWAVPCVRIEDKPRFAWRGLMLDPARFFLTKDYIKRYIDLLALHKMNRLHLHLTDSEAWTLQIDAYPELTNMDKWPLKSPERARGVYSHDDIREIVRYAEARNVTVIPEIELPAHAAVVLAAYPELMCPGNPLRAGTRAWDGKCYEWAEYCPAAESTYKFIETVLAEVMGLFPSPYIHLGADEYFGLAWKQCPDCQKQAQAARDAGEDSGELQALFANCLGDREKYLLYRRLIQRVCAFVVSKGRQPVLWDDLSWQGNYPAGAVVNQWHYKGGMDCFQTVITPMDPAAEAAAAGHDVIASPYSHLYFDLGDARNTELVYKYEPMPEGLTDEQARHILGPSAPAWNQPQQQADQMIFPRLVALSEVGWTARDNRDWDNFTAREKEHCRRLALLGVKFPRDWTLGGPGTLMGGWKPADLTADAVTLEWDASALIKEAGAQEVIMLYTKGEHGIAILWAALLEDEREIARDTHPGWSGAGKNNFVYTLPLAERKPGARYTIKAGFDCHQGRDSAGDVFLRKQEGDN